MNSAVVYDLILALWALCAAYAVISGFESK